MVQLILPATRDNLVLCCVPLPSSCRCIPVGGGVDAADAIPSAMSMLQCQLLVLTPSSSLWIASEIGAKSHWTCGCSGCSGHQSVMEHKLLAGSQAALQLKVYIDFQTLMNLAASGRILDI